MISFGTRLKYIRNFRGYSQAQLGKMLGFSDSSADVRISQYESDTRMPKAEMVQKIADALQVSTACLTAPVPSTPLEILEFYFWLEEFPSSDYVSIFKEWTQQNALYTSGQISWEEYLEWKLSFAGE